MNRPGLTGWRPRAGLRFARYLACMLVFAVTATTSWNEPLAAPAVAIPAPVTGDWVINDELSDNTDDQVEAAIEAGGGKGSRGWFNRREDFYRGGSPDHELYDRISYDDVLRIDFVAEEFRFRYADGYVRVFHTDGRRRRTTANAFYSEGGADWSFANWDGAALIVEARPRDGGFTIETYTVENDGARLRIEMLIQPDSFREPISLVRVFDRRQ